MPKYRIESKRLRPIWRDLPFRQFSLIADPVLFWWLFGTYEGERIEFDLWQSMWLRDRSRLRAVEKAPQIGWSWTCALEALHEALLVEDATSIFVSVDQREASEKILYAKKAFSELPAVFQEAIGMSKDTHDELWFGSDTRPSRLMSIPATSALRGRKASIYVDESDFHRDLGIGTFRVSMGRITRGGRVSMGSTVFSQDTQLDLIMQANLHERARLRVEGHDESMEEVPTDVSCAVLPFNVAENPDVQESIELAFRNLPRADFLEEYGCVRGGLGATTFPADVILGATHGEGTLIPTWTEEGGLDLGELDTKATMAAGYDVSGGTGRHPSLLSVLVMEDRWRQRIIWAPSITEAGRDSGKPLRIPAQTAMLDQLLDQCRHLTLALDAQAIGLGTAQSLTEKWGDDRVIALFPGRGEHETEGGMFRESMRRKDLAVNLRNALQGEDGGVEIAEDRDQALQLRRTTIEGDRVVQPGAKRTSHFDVFWALSYAWYAARTLADQGSVYESHDLVVVQMG